MICQPRRASSLSDCCAARTPGLAPQAGAPRRPQEGAPGPPARSSAPLSGLLRASPGPGAALLPISPPGHRASPASAHPAAAPQSCTYAPRAPALARGCPQSLPHPLPRAHQGKRRRVREGYLQGAGLGHRGHPQVGIESSAATSPKPARACQGHEMNCGLRSWKELGDSYQSWE